MKHNLKNNYHNAEGVGDEDMKREILLSELAKLIVYSPGRVVSALRRAGIFVPEKTRKAQLVSMTSNALYKSKKFATLLVNFIIESNLSFGAKGNPTKKRFDWGDHRAEGNPTTSEDMIAAPPPEKEKFDWYKLLADSAKLVNGFGVLFGGKARADADSERAKADAAAINAQVNKDLLDHVDAIERLNGTQPNVGLYVGIAVGLLVVTGVVVLIVKSGK